MSVRTQQISAALKAGELSMTVLADHTGVILDIDRHQVLSLNPTGVFILQQLLDDQRSQEEARLVTAIAARYGIGDARAAEDLSVFLNDLTRLLAVD